MQPSRNARRARGLARRAIVPWVSLALVASCPDEPGLTTRNVLVEWQCARSREASCPRCARTRSLVRTEVEALRRELSAAGIGLRLHERLIEGGAARDSNQVYVNGLPLEDWLDDVRVGTSYCAPCSESSGRTTSCRTTIAGAETHEVLPSGLLRSAVKRALEGRPPNAP